MPHDSLDPVYRPAPPLTPPVYVTRRPTNILPPVTVSPSGSQTLLATLVADERFSTLVAAVTAANITQVTFVEYDDDNQIISSWSQETVDSIAPATIFAPTNEAFAKIDNATLATLLADPVALSATLLRHIIPGKSVRIPEGEY